MVGAVALAVIVATAVYVRVRHARLKPQGFIVALRALDQGGAVVLWRANYSTRPARGWVSRVDAGGRLAWVRELPDVAQSNGGQDGLAVTRDVVAVRYSHGGGVLGRDHAVAAFALTDGAPRWDVVLTAFHPEKIDGGDETEPGLDPYFAALGLGDRIFEQADDGTRAWLYTLDAATGRIVGRHVTDWLSAAPVMVGNRLVRNRSYTAHFLDKTSGDELANLRMHGGCVVGDEYYAVIGDGAAASLIALPGGDPGAAHVILTPFHPIGPPDALQQIVSCGSRGDHLVFLISTQITIDRDGPSAVVITDRTGHVLHTIALPDGVRTAVGNDSGSMQYSETAPLAGTLPRFAPYVAKVDGATIEIRLLMFDLDEGRIAWESPAEVELIVDHLFRAGDRWYLTAPLGDVIMSFDGKTGRLDAAVRASAHDGVGDILAVHAADDALWLYTDEWTTFDRASITVLDGRTLRPRFARGVAITDKTADVRRWIGTVR